MSTSPPLIVADRYRLIAPLGQGGMGRVWRATDVVLHREVAIKELVPPPGLTPEERQEMRERSLREARAIARLNNINVVRVFDVLRTDADPWIVMEYVPSRSLQDVLAEDGPFPPVRAAEIGLGVLNALRAAHRAGVVHRDVKPGNVLISEDGRVVLTDFGLATVPGDPNVTRTGLVLGSPAYIAPERARDGTAGPGADLWSLGATLYAAVEGSSPFARPSAIATLAALATENPPPARNAGPLKPVLNGLLRKDPAHRINADEAERLLLRATGRRSKLSFPMSPTMRRPGVGRERPSTGLNPPPAPGVSASAPVVPGPRPPITPARPQSNPTRSQSTPPVTPGRAQASPSGRAQANPPVTPGRAQASPSGRAQANPPVTPGRAQANPPVTPGRAQAGPPVTPGRAQANPAGPPVMPGRAQGQPPAGGRAPIFAPGKATVGRPPAETPTRVDAPKPPELDATKIENPTSGTGSALQPPAGHAPASRRPALDATMRGSGSAFGSITADEVAAHRKRPAATPAPQAAALNTTLADAPAPTQNAPVQSDLAQSAPAPNAPPRDQATPPPAVSEPPPTAPADTTQPDTSASTNVEVSAVATPSVETTEPDAPPAEASSQAGTDTDPAPEATAPATPDPSGEAQPTTPEAVVDSKTEAPKPTRTTTTKASRKKARAHTTPSADQAPTTPPTAPEPDPDEAAAAANQPTTTTPAAPENSEPKTPEANAPEANAPELMTPELMTPAAETPELKTPEADTPELKTPEVETPELKAPEVRAPEPKTPEVETPEANASEDETPKVKAPPADETKIDTPKTDTPKAATAEAATAEAATAGTKTPSAATPSAATPSAATRSADTPKAEATDAGKSKDDVSRTTVMKSAPDAGRTRIIKQPQASRSTKSPAVGASPVSGAPGFGQPARPAWQPMTVRDPSSGPRGITVFGITLTRRQTVIAIGVLVAVLLALVFLVPRAFAGDEGDQAQDSGRKATPVASATDKPSSAPAAPVATASKPPPTTKTAVETVPKGWYLYRGDGYSVPVPNNSSVRKRDTEVYFTKNNRLLIIDQSESPKPDPVADWKAQEAERRGKKYQDYDRIDLKGLEYHGKAADWEFTYTTDSGNPQHAVKRGFISTPGKQAYSISWYTSPGDWEASQKDLQIIYQGFKPER